MQSSDDPAAPGAAPAVPLERVLFALAGTMTLLAAVLAVTISKYFALLGVLVGVSEWMYVTLGACPASIVLRRACRLQSAIYDNDGKHAAARAEVMV